METRDIGKRLFVLRGTLRDAENKGLVFRQPTFELDPPYRYSNAVVFKLGRHGFMLGWWKKSPAESLQEHLVLALGGRTEGHIYEGVMGDAVQVARKGDGEWAKSLTPEQMQVELDRYLTQGNLASLMAVRDEEPI